MDLHTYAVLRRDAREYVSIDTYQGDRALRDYWVRGAGAAKIRWGTEGDLTRCHRLVGEKITDPSIDIWGLCQEYHIEALGEPNDPND